MLRTGSFPAPLFLHERIVEIEKRQMSLFKYKNAFDDLNLALSSKLIIINKTFNYHMQVLISIGTTQLVSTNTIIHCNRVLFYTIYRQIKANKY